MQQASLSNEQLKQIVRVIVMHDVSSTSVKQNGIIDTCRDVLSTLNLNYKGQYDRKQAQKIVFDELANG